MLKIVYIDEDGPLVRQNALSALFRSLVFFVAHSKSEECNIKRTNHRSSGCDQNQMIPKNFHIQVCILALFACCFV